MYTFEKIQEEDNKDIVRIMAEAFDDGTQLHTDEEAGGPAGYDNGELLKKLLLSCDVRKIKYKGNLLGIFAVKIQKDQGILELFCIDPAQKSNGHGTRIWQEIEKMYTVKTWYTETPDYSVRNRFFLRKEMQIYSDRKEKIWRKLFFLFVFERNGIAFHIGLFVILFCGIVSNRKFMQSSHIKKSTPGKNPLNGFSFISPRKKLYPS